MAAKYFVEFLDADEEDGVEWHTVQQYEAAPFPLIAGDTIRVNEFWLKVVSREILIDATDQTVRTTIMYFCRKFETND